MARVLGVACLLLVLTLAGACRRLTDARVLRLGYLPNLTHAPALTGVESGRFARAMGGVRLETQTFNAGPAAIEALLVGALDATYVGPAPTLSGHIHTRGRALRVVAGAASGGALFVVRAAAGIQTVADLRGKRIATPQLGNTQDVALRTFLARHGLAPRERGGDVMVVPLAPPDILTQFRLGNLDGAWVPEPWGSRMMLEVGARLFLDERDLWPGRAFATTLLVVRREYLRDAPDNVVRLLAAHAAEVARLQREPGEGRALANRAIARLSGRALPEALAASAWARVDFTTDPLPDSLAHNARAARALGFLRSDAIDGLFEAGPLRRALALAGPRP